MSSPKGKVLPRLRRSGISFHSKLLVRILVPRHCSTHRLWQDNSFRQESSLCITESTESSCTTNFIMIIQCSEDSVLWKGLFPLFFQSVSSKITNKAISILLRTFDSHPCQPNELWNQEHLWFQVHHTIPLRQSDHSLQNIFFRSHDTYSWDKDRMHGPSVHLTLLLLPPYPSPASSRPLQPERIFTYSLVRWENYLIKLQTMNAYIATLGGGYFLCRYLSQAVTLARWQRQVAFALGDASLASKCTINEAYNFIHAGRISKANAILRKTKKEARKRNDLLVLSMCDSALWFSHQVALAHNHPHVSKKSKLKEDHSQQEQQNLTALPIVSKTVDDFLRIRIVQS